MEFPFLAWLMIYEFRFHSSCFGYANTTYRDQMTAPTQRNNSADHTFLDFDEPLFCRQRSCSLDSTLRPQRFIQACLSLSKCFSLPFLPWLGRRRLRPALEAQPHRSHHLVRQDTLPLLLCQWPGLRRWSRPRRRKRKRQQNPPKRIKSRAVKDGR